VSLHDLFVEARKTLGDPGEGEAALKHAYRRAVLAHPPDRDPEGFRAIRDAYELLLDPLGRALELLRSEVPFVRPPLAPPLAAATGPAALADALLRLATTQVDAAALLGGPPEAGPQP
jgi:curved DNA-binding protein CbpA